MFKLNIIKYRNWWLGLSIVLALTSIILLFTLGLRFGLDFVGGSLLEIRYAQEQATVAQIQENLNPLNLGSLVIQPTDDSTIIRFREIGDEIHQVVTGSLSALVGELGEMEEIRFESIGPSIGQELRSKSFWIFLLVLVIIIIYIAIAFQKVSKPVASWKYGLVATISLFFNLLITLGIFVLLGYFYGTEINTSFIVALLLVLGYSVNDTIVIFDRIRENLPRSNDTFDGTVDVSINQSLARSINTTITTLLALIAVFFFGGETIRDFILALMIGIFFGSYSSLFIASPLLTLFNRRRSSH